MQQGGDHRLRTDPDTGLSPYRVACTPRSSVPLGSCTASSPSIPALSAAERALRFLRESDPTEGMESLAQQIRGRLRRLFELPSSAAVALTPSGTDAVYLVSSLGLRFGERVHHVVVGASELGGGTLRAARGLGISDLAPFGEGGLDQPLEGLASRCSAQPVYLRDDDGDRLEIDQVDERVDRLVRSAAPEAVVVVHLVAHSKTGLRAPSAGACARLQEDLGDRVIVMVDAAQGRLAPRDIRNALDLGFPVLFTGSKFYSGPPFSCALFLPERLAADPGPLAPSLSDWFSRAELPVAWTEARASLREPGNPGLLLRWEAALHEIERYHALPPRHRAGVYHTFSGAIYEVFGPSQVIEVDVPRPPVHQLVTALGAYPSVFGFWVHGPDGPLAAPALKRLHALMDTEDDGRAFHLGQPVSLGPPSDDRPALLRVALGARLASELADTPDAGAAFFRETMRAIRARVEHLVESGAVS